ncbi:MAG: ABC transporter permease [Robiginitomaculum sp.]|nr:MAG: ABC transporter permease [Robiginitomaculum sp.]
MNDFTLVLKNLFRKKLRAILLLFSILSAFLIFGALGSFYKVFTAGVEVAAADRLITVNKINFTVSLPLAYVNRVRSIEGVRNASHASWFGGYYQDPRKQVQTFAIEADTYLAAYSELVMPDEQRKAFMETRDCLLTGIDLVDQYGWKLGDSVPINSNIWQKKDGSSVWEFTICAIFDGDKETVPANYLMFHYDYFNENLAFARDKAGWIILNSEDPAMNDDISKQIDTLFANSQAETKTSTESAFNKAFLQQMGNIGLILSSVIGAAFATILMIVGTTMVMAVSERTKEIAVMKTLGFRTGRIFRLVLSESLLLALLGGLIGLGIAWALVDLAIGPALSGFLPGMRLTADIALLAIVLMLALGLITGILPALKAMNVAIVDALGKN